MLALLLQFRDLRALCQDPTFLLAGLEFRFSLSQTLAHVGGEYRILQGRVMLVVEEGTVAAVQSCIETGEVEQCLHLFAACAHGAAHGKSAQQHVPRLFVPPLA